MSVARRSLQVIAFICTLIVGAASMAVIVTQTTWFKEWLRGFIVRQAQGYLNGRLTIGRLDGNLVFGVELEDIGVTMNGERVVEVKDVGLDYNAFTFIGGRVILDDIRLNQPTIRLVKTAEGWNITRLVKVRTPDPDQPRTRRAIEIGEIGISDGALDIAGEPVGTSGVELPDRIERLNASIGVKSDADALDVEIAHVSLRARHPAIGINDMSGRIVRTANQLRFEKLVLRTEASSIHVDGAIDGIEEETPSVAVEARAEKVALDEIARIVPALRGYTLQPAFTLTANGPADRLAVNVDVRDTSLGQVRGDLTLDAAAPGRRLAGTVDLRHANIGAAARREGLTSDITGEARIDLALPDGRRPLSGTYSVDAERALVAGYEVRDLTARGRIDGRLVRVDARAAAYGGRATAEGHVRTGSRLELDLRGRAVDLDLRNLPPQLDAPGVASDLDLDYHLTGRGRAFSGEVRLDASTLAGAAIAPGTRAAFSVGEGAPTYTSQGAVTGLDIQRVGRGFGVAALTADRYKSRINATFSVNAAGGGSSPLSLDATGTLNESDVFGARIPRMDVGAALAGQDLQVRALGQFSSLDPSVITGNRSLEGDVNGAVDAIATIRNYRGGLTVDAIDARGRVNLGQSTIAGLGIDSAVVDGAFEAREASINQLSVAGPDLNVQAQGTLALDDAGSSHLVVHVDSPTLDAVGAIVGRPLKGAVTLDATVRGNARELRTEGTLEGSNIGYGNSEALDLESTFQAVMPGLRAADASVQASSHATFLEIGGQRLTELTATTKYGGKTVEFDALAREGVRELGAAGSLVLHPDHQEVHLTNVALRTEGVEWRSEPGSEAAVQYGQDRIAVRDVRLVNGAQRIEADGVIGSEGRPLKIRLDKVDVGQLDRLLLADYGLEGTLDAAAVLSGPRNALQANGTFSLSAGAFRQFRFESLGGKIEYGGSGVQLDVRLQQNPQSWIAARGYVPAALFAGRASTASGAHAHGAPRPGDKVNLEITSTPIDLGVIQGFTSYVTDVTGTVQANVKVIGAAGDPHMQGMVEIRGGALTVPDLGTAYTGIDTRIDLRPDAVSISEMRVVDEHQKVLTLGGSLGVHERSVGDVDVQIRSEDFEVIDNDLADLKLDMDMRVTGELRAPRVRGQIEIENGTVNVGELLERTAADPYATEAAALDTGGSPGAPPAPPAPGVFNGLDLDVALSIPSNLVIRGSDLRPANAPISIGDMSVTVGGLVSVRKPAGSNDPRILGEVNTIRGNYQFQGRRFEIVRDGRIRFQGADELNPILDLRARRLISGVETFVRVQGTMRQPELSFASNPPLDEADILSLIIFNQPVNELGEGQQISLAERAGALAGGYLASGLARSIGNALELDEFEIQAQGETGGPTLTVGEQVGEKLFFRVRQGFGDAQSTEFVLEYQIRDFLRLQASMAEVAGGSQRVMFRRVERGGLDLIFFFSY